MTARFAIVLLLGSTVGVMAADGYADYTAYYNENAVFDARPKVRAPKGKHKAVEPVDSRRYDEDRAPKNPDNLTPGFRTSTGIYVPPDYSTNPRGPSGDGFGTAPNPSAGGPSAPNPFAGPLGTRR